MPNPILQRVLGYFSPDSLPPTDAAQRDVNLQILPAPARPGDTVGGTFDPGVRLVDPRPNPTLTGRYPSRVVQDVIAASTRKGVDPKLALAIALQESSLGKVAPDNPLSENFFDVYPEPTAGSDVLDAMSDEDPRTMGLYDLKKRDSNYGAYQFLRANMPHQDAAEFAGRSETLDFALDHLKHVQQRHAGASEAHQIQAYNGLGRPKMSRLAGYLYNAKSASDLPTDYYGKRIQDIRDNVVAVNPIIKALLGN